jgi:hypothetical protein
MLPGRGIVVQCSFVGGRPPPALARRAPGAVPAAPGSAFPLPRLRLPPGAAGRRLPEAVQRSMEVLLGADLSGVRVHVGREAAELGALAFTAGGSDVVFAPGQYDPGSPRGLRLLAHELAHVVQQRSGRARNPFGSGVAVVHDLGLEAEAERLALRAAIARPAAPCVAAGAVPPPRRPVQALPPASPVSPLRRLPAIQRMEISQKKLSVKKQSLFEALLKEHGEVILLIVEVLDMRPLFDPHAKPGAGLRWIANFGLTCKRIHNVTSRFTPFWAHSNLISPRKLDLTGGVVKPDDVGELGKAIKTYPSILEPIQHGAHVEQTKVGYVGAATLLAFLHDGKLVPWNLDKEDLQVLRKSPDDLLIGLEKAIREKVEKYAGLMQIAEKVKVQIYSMHEKNMAKQLIDNEQQVLKARQHSPIDLFDKVLIQNLSRARPKPSEASNDWEQEKLEHQRKTRKLLLSGKSKISEYDKLSKTEEEDKAYGHSEQLWMMSDQWRSHLEALVRAADHIVLALALGEAIKVRAQKITLFCNRSPCTSCGRYLVVELENFWKLLKRRLALKLSDEETKQLFSQVFAFQLVYTSLYKEKDEYPNATILEALRRAGWHTAGIKAIASNKRKATCLSEVKVEEVKVDLEALKKQQEKLESRDEHKEKIDLKFLEEYRETPRRSNRHQNKEKKTYHESSFMDVEDEEEEEEEGEEEKLEKKKKKN